MNRSSRQYMGFIFAGLLLNISLPVMADTYPAVRKYYASYDTGNGWAFNEHTTFAEAAQESWDAYTPWPGETKIDWYTNTNQPHCQTKEEPGTFYGNNQYVDVYSTISYNGNTSCTNTGYYAAIVMNCPDDDYFPDG